MQDIRLTQFFFPAWLHVSFDAESDQVIIQQTFFYWKVEVIRLPLHDALKFAEFLEIGAINSMATPVVKGLVGEIKGKSVRPLGIGRTRIKLSVKRSESIAIAVRATFGLKTQYAWARISPEETQRFAKGLREAHLIHS